MLRTLLEIVPARMHDLLLSHRVDARLQVLVAFIIAIKVLAIDISLFIRNKIVNMKVIRKFFVVATDHHLVVPLHHDTAVVQVSSQPRFRLWRHNRL